MKSLKPVLLKTASVWLLMLSSWSVSLSPVLIIPTFIAQQWFMPMDEEDILDFDTLYVPADKG